MEFCLFRSRYFWFALSCSEMLENRMTHVDLRSYYIILSYDCQRCSNTQSKCSMITSWGWILYVSKWCTIPSVQSNASMLLLLSQSLKNWGLYNWPGVTIQDFCCVQTHVQSCERYRPTRSTRKFEKRNAIGQYVPQSTLCWRKNRGFAVWHFSFRCCEETSPVFSQYC